MYKATVNVVHDQTSYAPGDVVRVSGDDAKRLLEAGAVEEVAGEAPKPAKPATPTPPRAGLDGIDFASDEAAEAASTAKLAAADFGGLKPSGQGGYTKADVEKVTQSKQAK